MIQFNPIEHTYVAPIDLKSFSKSMDRLETGHKEAMKEYETLKNTFHNLNLNNKEFEPGGFVDQQLQQITSILDDNTMYGNAMNAYDKLKRFASDMFDNPAMQGRLQSNEAYEDFKKKLNDSKLPQAYKNWLTEINPYHYDDGEDADGNIVIGDIWKPNKEFVDQIGLDAIFTEALKYIPDNQGKAVRGFYLDATGKPTQDKSRSADGKIYKDPNFEGKYTVVTPYDVLTAINTVMSSNPAIGASLQQDFDYKIWEYKKNVEQAIADGGNTNIVVPGITTDNGTFINDINAYLMSIIDPFCNLSSYVSVKTTPSTRNASLSKDVGVDGKYHPTQDDKIEDETIANNENLGSGGGTRYGGTRRIKAALGTELDDEEKSDDDNIRGYIGSQLDLSQLENISTKRYWREVGTGSNGNVPIFVNDWTNNTNIKLSAGNQIIDFISMYDKDLAKTVFNIRGLEKYCDDNDLDISDIYEDIKNKIYLDDVRYSANSTNVPYTDQSKYIERDLINAKTAIQAYQSARRREEAIIKQNGNAEVDVSIFDNRILQYNIHDLKLSSILQFGTDMDSQDYTTNNPCSKELLRRTKALDFENDTELELTLGANVARHYLMNKGLRSFDESPFNVKNSVENDGSVIITINKQNQNLLPELMGLLVNADEACTNLNWAKWARKKRHSDYYDNDCYGINIITKDGQNRDAIINTLRYDSAMENTSNPIRTGLEALGDCYNYCRELLENAEKQIGKATDMSYVSLMASDCMSEADFIATLDPQYDKRSDNSAEIKDRQNAFADWLKDINFTDSYMAIKGGEKNKEDNNNYEKTYKQNKYSTIINAAANAKCLTSRFCPVNTFTKDDGSLNSNKGYILTITPSKSDGEQYSQLKDYVGKTLTIYVEGAIDEGYNTQLADDPVTRTNTAYNIMHNTNSRFVQSTNDYYMSGIGATRFDAEQNKDGSYSFTGTLFQTELEMTENRAKEMSLLLNQLSALKQYHDDGYLDDDTTIKRIADIADVFFNKIGNTLKDNDKLDIDNIPSRNNIIKGIIRFIYNQPYVAPDLSNEEIYDMIRDMTIKSGPDNIRLPNDTISNDTINVK